MKVNKVGGEGSIWISTKVGVKDKVSGKEEVV